MFYYKLLIAIDELDRLGANTQNDLMGMANWICPVGAVAGALISVIPSFKKVGYGVIIGSIVAYVVCLLVDAGLLTSIGNLAK